MRTPSFLSLGASALLASLLVLARPQGAGAIKDTIKNRIKVAEQFLEENPVEESIEAVARPQLAAIRTAEEATLFKRNLEQVDYKKLHAVLRHSMVKHFTAPELEYLLNMYSQPLGRSVMAKMGAYTSEITPKLHEAMQPMMQANANFLAAKMLDEEEANGGKHPATEQAPELPPRHIKVPDGVYQGSTIQDVLDKKTKNQKPQKKPAEMTE